jgi:hypothetical protein
MMNNLYSHLHDVADRLKELRNVFSEGPEGSKYLGFFDEYLDANELELALHAVCDFLLEPTSAAVDDAVLEKIAVLHRLMKLEDDCAARLKEKPTTLGGSEV